MSELVFSKEDLIKKGSDNGLDARKLVQIITAVALGSGVVYLLNRYVIPELIELSWGLLELGIAGLCLFVLYIGYKWIWKNLKVINKFIAKYTLGLIVEWDEFILQEMQIDKAEQDVENMLVEREKIEGKYNELSTKLRDQEKDFKLNMLAAETAARDNHPEDAEDFQLEAGRNQLYIENLTPIVTDMKFIVDFSQDIYKVLKRKIKNSKADLRANKDVFYAVMAGAKTIESAKRAMIGDVELNNNADYAKEMIKQKIALSIGQMRTSMEILSTVTRGENYKDKAKIEFAKERLKAINFSTGEDAVPVPQQSIAFKGIEPIRKYGDLL